MKIIKKYFLYLEIKRLSRLRKQAALDLWYFHENGNRGLLIQKLSSMLDVSRVTLDSGMRCYVDVRMSDGYSIFASGLWEYDALRKAARLVVRRLQETRLAFPEK
jgi:hypothetical protein